MSIKEMLLKINPVIEKGIAPGERTGFYAFFHYRVKPFYYLFLILVFISIFFALGQISNIDEGHIPIKIEYSNVPESASAVMTNTTDTRPKASEAISDNGQVIGSKTGKKYYFPWCSVVKRIKPENQVHFASIRVAKSSGFVAGGNCKGLQ